MKVYSEILDRYPPLPFEHRVPASRRAPTTVDGSASASISATSIAIRWRVTGRCRVTWRNSGSRSGQMNRFVR
jgi:hypothetical protein